PRLLENTAIAALSKNNGINPATTIVGDFNKISSIIITNCPNAPNKNHTVTAFEEPKAKVAAISIPGTAHGNDEYEIQLNESINSATKVRTPNCKIAK